MNVLAAAAATPKTSATWSSTSDYPPSLKSSSYARLSFPMRLCPTGPGLIPEDFFGQDS